MVERITSDRALAALKPNAKPYERPISDVKGLVIRVFPTGTKSFEFRYVAVNGTRRRLPLGTYPSLGYADAVKRGRARRVEVDDGGDPAEERAAKRHAARTGETLTELADAYFKAAAKGLHGGRKRPKAESTLKIERSRFDNHVKEALGARRFADLKRRDLKAFMNGLAAEGALSPDSVSAVGRTLSAIFSFAVDQDRIESNPIFRLTTPLATKPRERLFDESALAKLWRALSTPVVVADGNTLPTRWGKNAPDGRASADLVSSLALRFIVATLARRGECVGAKWGEIDLKAKTWTVPPERCKNRRTHLVPLSALAVDILGEARKLSVAADDDYLFPSLSDPKKHVSGDTVTQAVERTCKRLKIAHGSPHDIRRTAATALTGEALGFRRFIVSALLSHTPQEGAAVTAVYDRNDYLPERRAALEAWGKHVLALADGKAADDAANDDDLENAA